MAAIYAEPYRPTLTTYGVGGDMAAFRASILGAVAVRPPDRWTLIRDVGA